VKISRPKNLKKLYKYIYKPRKLESLDHIGLHATQHKIPAQVSEVVSFLEPFQSKYWVVHISCLFPSLVFHVANILA